MRIQKVSYVVTIGTARHVITMTRIAGLKLRELVPVKVKRSVRR